MIDKAINRIVLKVGGFLEVILFNEVSTKIIWTIYFYLISWQAILKLRESLNSYLYSILCLLINVFVLLIVAKLLIKFFPKNLVNGKPLFGRLGGTGKRLLFKTDEAHQYLNVTQSDDDVRRNREFRDIHKENYKNILKKKYNERENGSIISTALLDFALEKKTWEDRWQEILATPLKTMRFGDIFSEKFVPFQLSAAYFERSSKYIDGMFAFCNLLILLIVYNFINKKIEFVNLIRVEIAIGICAAMVWTIIGLHKFQQMHLKSPPHSVTSFKKLKIGNKFFKIARNYEIRRIFLFYAIYLPVYAVAMGTALILLRLFDGQLSSNQIQWHINYLLYLISGNLILAISFYMASFIIQYFKALVVTLMFTVLALPFEPLFDFVTTGILGSYDQWVDKINLKSVLVGAVLAYFFTKTIDQFKK